LKQQATLKIEINEEGNITGRYTGIQLDTIESIANPDGSSTFIPLKIVAAINTT
jgi:hypothetical protein